MIRLFAVTEENINQLGEKIGEDKYYIKGGRFINIGDIMVENFVLSYPLPIYLLDETKVLEIIENDAEDYENAKTGSYVANPRKLDSIHFTEELAKLKNSRYCPTFKTFKELYEIEEDTGINLINDLLLSRIPEVREMEDMIEDLIFDNPEMGRKKILLTLA